MVTCGVEASTIKVMVENAVSAFPALSDAFDSTLYCHPSLNVPAGMAVVLVHCCTGNPMMVKLVEIWKFRPAVGGASQVVLEKLKNLPSERPIRAWTTLT